MMNGLKALALNSMAGAMTGVKPAQPPSGSSPRTPGMDTAQFSMRARQLAVSNEQGADIATQRQTLAAQANTDRGSGAVRAARAANVMQTADGGTVRQHFAANAQMNQETGGAVQAARAAHVMQTADGGTVRQHFAANATTNQETGGAVQTAGAAYVMQTADGDTVATFHAVREVRVPTENGFNVVRAAREITVMQPADGESGVAAYRAVQSVNVERSTTDG